MVRVKTVNQSSLLRFFLCIILLISSVEGFAQQDAVVIKRMKSFHEMLITRNIIIDTYIDDSLSYGHSNWWVESRSEFKQNLGNKLVYHSFKEDSIRVSVNKGMAHVRFVADIDVSMDGKRNTYHLKVLEVWVKRKKSWKIFARQAVR